MTLNRTQRKSLFCLIQQFSSLRSDHLYTMCSLHAFVSYLFITYVARQHRAIALQVTPCLSLWSFPISVSLHMSCCLKQQKIT